LTASKKALTFGSAGFGYHMDGQIDDIVVANAALDVETLMAEPEAWALA
jgi:hypothetical protein